METEHAQPPLDLDGPQMRELAARVIDRLVEHIVQAPTLPAGGVFDEGVSERCLALPREAPELGVPPGPLLDQLFDEWLPASFLTTGPGYLAYVPGGGLFTSAIGHFLGAALNRFTGVWAPAPFLVELEGRTIGWLREWMGFPEGATGLFTPGGSTSNLTAIVTARELHLGPDLRAGVLYASEDVHHCVHKSARLAGIAADRVRGIAVDERRRLRPEALRAAIAEDRDAGLRPFLVVSSAGTTNTGAIDPLDEIGAIARSEGLWHHVDGAYGAFFRLVPELRPALAGIEGADSLTLDPHKGLFLPYGTGALLVRDEAHLRAVHEVTAGYLPELPAAEHYDPSRIGPELSRPYRGLPLWLAVQLHGAAAFREAIADKRALALRAAERLRSMPGVTLLDEPQLSIVPFRASDPEWSEEEGDRRTRALLEEVNARGRVHLSGATVAGRFVGRICVLCFRTDAERLEEGLEDLEAARGAMGG